MSDLTSALTEFFDAMTTLAEKGKAVVAALPTDDVATLKAHIWKELKSLETQELYTLARRSPFTVVSVNDNEAMLKVRTGNPFRIPRENVENAYVKLMRNRQVIFDDKKSYTGSYTAAMLNAVLPVNVAVKPLRLYLDKAA